MAVIDTGVDYTHPDLASNIWTNPGEIAGNGIDDDHNGFVDDVHGYDFVNNDGNPMDDNRHGTHVAGTIAAAGNNGLGVTGVNWSSSIMALKFLSSGGSGSTSDAIRAVNYATMMKTTYGVNVRLTSNSWGGGGYDQSLYNAIQSGGNAGILFVAAAGNSGTNNDASPFYPASYNLDSIIAVAATDDCDQLADFSCYGATSVDLAAPGVDIYSTVPGNAYASLSGTSMATPHVSGVVALACAVAPAASRAEVRQAVLGGADPLASLTGRVATGGRLNARKTLDLLGMHVAGSRPAAGEIVTSLITQIEVDFSSPYDPASVQASDLTVNGIAATGFDLVDADSIRFRFSASPVSAQGPQTMSIAEGAIERTPGHGPLHAWTGVFHSDAVPMQVVATDPAEDQTLASAPSYVTVQMNEGVAAGSLRTSGLVLDYGTVTGVSLAASNAVRYSVSGLVPDGDVHYSLVQGAVTDVYGNPSPAYTGHFTVDNPLINRYVSTDVPRSIPDNTSITSTLSITSSFRIVDVDVELDITHTYDADLSVVLVSPGGTRVQLFAYVGGWGENFTNTVLDDEAAVSILDGDAPFTGRYRPEYPLSAFDESDAVGTWQLEVSDAVSQDVGTLNRWALVIESAVDYGPRVVSHQPAADVGGPVSSVRVTFSEAIDATSFTLADIRRLDGPAGAITPTGVTAVAGSGNTRFDVAFPAQSTPGSYGLVLGPYITDATGHNMDQDRDLVCGEQGADPTRAEVGDDQYLAAFTIVLPDLAGSLVSAPARAAPGQTIQVVRNYQVVSVPIWPDFAIQYHLSTNGTWGDGDDIALAPDEWITLAGGKSVGSHAGSVAVTVPPTVRAGVYHLLAMFDATDTVQESNPNNNLVTGSDVTVTGPMVVDYSPSGIAPGAVSSVRFTFDHSMGQGSFDTASDVSAFIGPGGEDLKPQITTFAWLDDRTLSVSFGTQTAGGWYQMRIGPAISDTAGNQMDQNLNGVPGEPSVDGFLATFAVPSWSQFQFFDGFETGVIGPSWTAASTNEGRIQVRSTDSPYDGAYQIVMDDAVANSTASRNELTLSVNLSGATQVQLGYWYKTGSSETVTALPTGVYTDPGAGEGVSISTDGAYWYAADLPTKSTAWKHRIVDIVAVALQAGFAMDADFYIRFQQQGTGPTSSNYGIFWDDVTLGPTDSAGPKVSSQSPTLTAGPIDSLTLTFDEAIASGSFTASDIASFSGPASVDLLPAVTSITGSDCQWTIHFATQSTYGDYTMVIGPRIVDLAGNAMNQDGDATNGEATQDRYTALTTLRLVRNYYVNDSSLTNDVYTTATGNSANDGLTPATPKASLQSVIDAYVLGPGDIVFVDTGVYRLDAGITLTDQDTGNATGILTIRGSTHADGTTLNLHGLSGNVIGSAASYVTLEYLNLTGATSGAGFASWRDSTDIVCPMTRNCRLYGNSYGVLLKGTSYATIQNSVLFGNAAAAVYAPAATGSVYHTSIISTTIVASGADGVRLDEADSSLTVTNSIFQVSGSGRYVLNGGTYQFDLPTSDYNDFVVTGGASIAYWSRAIRGSLSEWQLATGQDAHSLTVDPLFADPSAGDYHLKSEGGRCDPATGTWLTDTQTSWAIDAGDPSYPVGNEPSPNGARVDLGAYGGTAEASREPPERRLLVLNPNAGQMISGTSTVLWLYQGVAWQAGDTVCLEYSANAGEGWGTMASGTDVDVRLGQFNWDTTAAVPDYGTMFKWRLTSNADTSVSDASDKVFIVHNHPVAYYVNDASTVHDVYTTAPGNDGNDGGSPATPMASLATLVAQRDLEPGDVVYVDTGYYSLGGTIEFGTQDQGGDSLPLTIRGSTHPDGTTLELHASSGSVIRSTATYLTLENLSLTGATRRAGFEPEDDGADGSGAHNTIRECRLYGNEYGVSVYWGPDYTTIQNCLIYGNTGAGIRAVSSGTWAEGTQIINNTVIAANTDALLLQTRMRGTVILNNIIQVSGSDKYAIRQSDDALTSDYNDFYLTSGAAVGYWLNVIRTSLADWQSASGQDAHSLSEDPLFANPAGADYHLKSGGGRYNPATGLPPEDPAAWVVDSVSSPSIDAGDPASAYADEPAPNGARVNQGAYGNTAQASKSDVPPTVSGYAVTDDTGLSGTDHITYDDTPTLTFCFSEPVYGSDSSVVVTAPSGGAITPDGIAGWGTATLTVAFTNRLLDDGTYVVTLRGTGTPIHDSSGNPLDGGADWVSQFILDTVAPAVPAVPDLQAASDTGISDTDDITKDNTPTFDLSGASPYFVFYRNGANISGYQSGAATYTTATQADGSAPMPSCTTSRSRMMVMT